ncbi:alpha/beta hydrolase [Nonomuraea maritima]|uniref:alpha/beta fold hydrolase n=1 Tax=Nonomuraea maritima TaxID=683260 RepID=UPI00316ABD53
MTVVALAFGGPIAAEFTVHHPERVSRLCLVDGVGHLPHFERPDETAEIVLDFLRRS